MIVDMNLVGRDLAGRMALSVPGSQRLTWPLPGRRPRRLPRMIMLDPSKIEMDAEPYDKIDEDLHTGGIKGALQERRVIKTRAALWVIAVVKNSLQENATAQKKQHPQRD